MFRLLFYLHFFTSQTATSLLVNKTTGYESKPTQDNPSTNKTNNTIPTSQIETGYWSKLATIDIATLHFQKGQPWTIPLKRKESVKIRPPIMKLLHPSFYHSHTHTQQSTFSIQSIFIILFLLGISVGFRRVVFTVIGWSWTRFGLGAWTRPGSWTRLGGFLCIVLVLVLRLGFALLAARLGPRPGLAARPAARVTAGPGSAGTAAGSAGTAPRPGLSAPTAGSRATAAASLWPIFNQFDFASIDFGVVKFVQSIPHVRRWGKLDDSLIPVSLMSISIGDFASLTHVVFQILETHKYTNCIKNCPFKYSPM